MTSKTLLFVLVLVLISSCKEKKSKPIYYSEDDYIPEEVNPSVANLSDIVCVPYREESGVKLIAVKVNGMKLDMILDTGCSSTLISIAEARYLAERGQLSEDDFLGISQAQIADGSIVENMVINLKEVIIDDRLVCHDVAAVVSGNTTAPLLLGNEVLNRAASYEIDQRNQQIVFKLK